MKANESILFEVLKANALGGATLRRNDLNDILSFKVNEFEPVQLFTGYQVGGFSKVIKLSQIDLIDIIKSHDLQVQLYRDVMALVRQAGNEAGASYIGIWKNENDILEIEISKHIDNLNDAVTLGLKTNQAAIFDWSLFTSLHIYKTFTKKQK